MVPAFATAPVLIIVGVLMFRTTRTLPFGVLEEMVPAFLTLVLIPLTLSITQGLLWGLVAYVVAFVVAGRRRDLTFVELGPGHPRDGAAVPARVIAAIAGISEFHCHRHCRARVWHEILKFCDS